MMYGKPNATEPSLHYRHERTTVEVYSKDQELIGVVPVHFSVANTQGLSYEVIDVVYGDLLNVLPEYTTIVEAIQEKIGFSYSIEFCGRFTHDANLI